MASPDDGSEKGKRVRFLLGLIAMVVIFYAVASSLMTEGAYFIDAAEARTQLTQYAGKYVRVKGSVISGSWLHAEGTTVHTFDIEEKGQVIKVTYDGPMPDVFKEGIPVIAEGSLDQQGLLTATEIVAKCPSKYEEGKASEAAKQHLGGTR